MRIKAVWLCSPADAGFDPHRMGPRIREDDEHEDGPRIRAVLSGINLGVVLADAGTQFRALVAANCRADANQSNLICALPRTIFDPHRLGPRIREDDEFCGVESRFTHRALSCGITRSFSC
jgi:hypothetical protein